MKRSLLSYSPRAMHGMWNLASRYGLSMAGKLRGILFIGGSAQTIVHPQPVWAGSLRAVAVTAICTGIAYPFSAYFGVANVVMLYLLGTTLAALRLGRGTSLLLAVLNTLAFDFFFVPPVFSFDVQDIPYFFTLLVMLSVATIIAGLVTHIRDHRDIAGIRERRAAVLYTMSRELAAATEARAMVTVAIRHVCEVFQSEAMVLVTDSHSRLTPMPTAEETWGPKPPRSVDAAELKFAHEVVERGERCVEEAIYLPLFGNRRVKGIMIVWPQNAKGALPLEEMSLLDAFAALLALSLQRARITEAAEAAKISAERLLLRNTLLASISHDLRTPLSAIAGAGSLLAQPEYALSDDRRAMLGHLVERKARDMTKLLTNVLELVQMEIGEGALRTEWHAIDELVDVALRTNAASLAQWRIVLNLAADLPFVMVEATLIVKILSNLLENAAKYTPPGTTITIAATARADGFLLVVEDDGPGLPAGDPERMFDKFQRGHSESNIVGVGLGLTICRAAARLHGGSIAATRRLGGGARFEIALPVQTQNELPDAPVSLC